MRYAHAFSLAAVTALYASANACGGNVVVDGAGTTGAGGTRTATTSTATTTTATTTTATTSTVTSGAGGSSTCTTPFAGDCKTDADCGAPCAPITPGGYLVCLGTPPEATSCSAPTNGGQNQCCTSADCKKGKCYSTSVFPYCGGPPKQIYNACVTDQCTSDADCPPSPQLGPQICTPSGFNGVPVRSCFTAYCHTDADCTAHPCGACMLITGPCCNFPVGLACVYPGGCTKNTDCKHADACSIDQMTGATGCGGSPPCPL
jgi:hypothetical protein